jgi:hypothetical protein
VLLVVVDLEVVVKTREEGDRLTLDASAFTK